MAVKSHRLSTTFPLDKDSDQTISDTSLIRCLVKNIDPKRKSIAKKQIAHLIKKITLYPEKRMVYITLIKKLIEFETNHYGVNYE